MIHDANRCLCEDCMDYRAAVIRRRARMGLRPIPQIPPVAATRDAAAGATTTHKERWSAGHPTGRRVTQGGAPCACVANAPAAQLPSCSEPASLGLGQMSSTAGETLPIPRDAAGAVLGQHLHGVHEAHGVSGLPAHAGRHVAASVATGVGAPTVGIAS